MKILLLPPYFIPERMASSHLDYDRYEAFAKKGWDMVVYTPVPTRGISTDEANTYKKLREEVMFGGRMHVFRFSMFREGKCVALRALRYCLCCIKQLYYGLKTRNVDLVYLVSTPPIQGLIGVILKKVKGIPFVYNLQDIFPDSMVGIGMTKENSFVYKVGRWIENITYRYADRIIVISNDFRENLLSKGVPKGKIEVIYNWVNSDNVIPVKKEDNILFDELGIPRDEKFRIVYAGNFGLAQNIDVIINAARILQKYPDIQFLFFGHGDIYESYKMSITNNGPNNIFFYPFQKLEAVKYVYSLGSLGLVCCKPGIGKGAFPSKTWSILSAGVPVVANYDSDTDLEYILSSNDIGLFSPSGDANKMAEVIIEMYKSKDKCQEYSSNAREYVLKNVSKNVAVEKYIKVIEDVVKS